jgi:hypothetical protein
MKDELHIRLSPTPKAEASTIAELPRNDGGPPAAQKKRLYLFPIAV